MESFEPMLKKPRGYDTDGSNGMTWTSSSSGGNINMNMNPGMNLSSGVNYQSGPNPNQGHGFNPNAAVANPNSNPNPNPGVNEVIPGPPQGGYPPAMGGGSYGGSYGGGSGGSYGGGSYGGGSYENGNHSTHFEGLGFQQQQRQGSNTNVGDLECRRYKTDDGCPYGLNCRYKHGPTDERDFNIQISSSGSKTKPCMKFFRCSKSLKAAALL